MNALLLFVLLAHQVFANGNEATVEEEAETAVAYTLVYSDRFDCMYTLTGCSWSYTESCPDDLQYANIVRGNCWWGQWQQACCKLGTSRKTVEEEAESAVAKEEAETAVAKEEEESAVAYTLVYSDRFNCMYTLTGCSWSYTDSCPDDLQYANVVRGNCWWGQWQQACCKLGTSRKKYALMSEAFEVPHSTFTIEDFAVYGLALVGVIATAGGVWKALQKRKHTADGFAEL